MKALFSRMFLATLFMFVISVSLQAQTLLSNEEKISGIISQMTLEE